VSQPAPARPGELPARRRREIALVAALALLPQIPFLGNAFALDAPVFLAVARRILEAPLDPYGFHMLWDPTSTFAAQFNRNPPLLSYYLAAWMALFGESEVLLHAALLPFPLLAALAFRGIARRLAGEGLAPAALLVATPAFVVLAGEVLLDVPVLACWLLAFYALLRGQGEGGTRWQWLAGAAAAAAGLTKYVGFATAPLLAAGALLLYPARRPAALGRLLGPPLVLWGLFCLATARLYGAPHPLDASDVLLEGQAAAELWNQLASVPVYYGAALLFPMLLLARALLRGTRGGELAVLGVLLGTAAVTWVLPHGRPPRRVPLDAEEAVLGALGFAGAFLLWARALSPRQLRAGAEAQLVWLWLVGLLAFSCLGNWHVNAADALLAAPPVLLALFCDPALRPSRRAQVAWLAVMLPFSLLLAWAEARQANYYREGARRIATEIGDQPGRRWFVGHWGLQYYLEREGFRPVPPTGLAPAELAVDDWVATARNVSQLEVARNLARFEVRGVWTWSLEGGLPLRTTNGDAGAGFYSHHSGYLPFAFSRAPVERIALGRVTAVRR